MRPAYSPAKAARLRSSQREQHLAAGHDVGGIIALEDTDGIGTESELAAQSVNLLRSSRHTRIGREAALAAEEVEQRVAGDHQRRTLRDPAQGVHHVTALRLGKLAPRALEGLLEQEIPHAQLLQPLAEALNDGVADVLLHAEGIGGPGGDGSVVGSGYELLCPERCAQTQSQDKEKELLLHG